MRIATQNVGGMRGEFAQRHGYKIALLRTLIHKDTDFLVLTEAKANAHHIHTFHLKRNLRPTVFSLSADPRGGVILYSHTAHTLVDGSQRESN